MPSRYDLSLFCPCGNHVDLRAEAIPEAWVDDQGGLWDAPLHRCRCERCGRRGRPQVIISPVENRDKSMRGDGVVGDIPSKKPAG